MFADRIGITVTSRRRGISIEVVAVGAVCSAHVNEGFAGRELRECMGIERLVLAAEQGCKNFGVVGAKLKADASAGIGFDGGM